MQNSIAVEPEKQWPRSPAKPHSSLGKECHPATLSQSSLTETLTLNVLALCAGWNTAHFCSSHWIMCSYTEIQVHTHTHTYAQNPTWPWGECLSSFRFPPPCSSHFRACHLSIRHMSNSLCPRFCTGAGVHRWTCYLAVSHSAILILFVKSVFNSNVCDPRLCLVFMHSES